MAKLMNCDGTLAGRAISVAFQSACFRAESAADAEAGGWLMCRQLSPGYPLRRIAARTYLLDFATVNPGACCRRSRQMEWKLCPAKMNRGDCGMVKTAKGIVKG